MTTAESDFRARIRAELRRAFAEDGLEAICLVGVTFAPRADQWRDALCKLGEEK